MPETMHSLRELREKRAKIVTEARAEYDKIDAAKGEAEAKEIEARFDSMMAEADKLKDRIDREERILQSEKDIATVIDERRGGRENERETRDTPTNEDGPRGSKEYRTAYNRFLRTGFEGMSGEQRTVLQVGYSTTEQRAAQDLSPGSAGGYLVPVQFQRELDVALKAYGGMMEVARVLPTAQGGTLQWPMVDDTTKKAAIIGTNTAPSVGGITFQQASLSDYTYGTDQILVPWQLMQDSAIDVEGLVRELLVIQMGRGLNDDFTTGSGSGAPQGVTACTKGADAAAVAAISYDDLVDLEHSVDPLYRKRGARWMFNDKTLKALKKLKDTLGRPLWAPGIIVGAPDEILGYGYTINQSMADIGASAKSVLFGDFSKYVIRAVRETMLIRLNERNMDKGQITFLAFARYDGKIVDASKAGGAGAIRHLLHPAS